MNLEFEKKLEEIKEKGEEYCSAPGPNHVESAHSKPRPNSTPRSASPWVDYGLRTRGSGAHLSVAQRCALTARTHRQPHSVPLGCSFGPMTRGPSTTVDIPTATEGADDIPATAEILAGASWPRTLQNRPTRALPEDKGTLYLHLPYLSTQAPRDENVAEREREPPRGNFALPSTRPSVLCPAPSTSLGKGGHGRDTQNLPPASLKLLVGATSLPPTRSTPCPDPHCVVSR